MTTRDELREKVAQAISDATLDWCGETPEIWDSHRIAAYAESDWEEAKEMAEDLDPRVIYDAIFAASPLAEPGA